MKAIHLLAISALALGLGACGEASLEQFEPTPTPPEATDFTLRTGVIPVMQAKNCIGCHNASQHASNLDLDVPPAQVYENLIAGGAKEAASYGEDVNLTYPEKSLLCEAGLTGATFAHAGQKFFEADDPGYQTLLGWVVNGALDD